VLGFLAVQQGVSVDEVATSGVGLAFVTFPQIINQLPALQSLFGVMFFGALFFAGLTSAIAILECCICGVKEKFDLSRTAAVSWVCALAFVVSLFYVTGGGLYYLDVVDHFINNYGLVLSGVFEVILIAWVVRRLRELQAYTNERSYLRAGGWWIVSLMAISPIMLTVVTAFNFYNEITTGYGGYPVSGLLVFGWGVSALAIVIAFVLQRVKSRESEAAVETLPEDESGQDSNREEI
jgi:neurotransmitter:Na+ symporter, NSS family